jgi:endonuclease/exonuclease/phosphatase family metal-dependent hydrolase
VKRFILGCLLISHLSNAQDSLKVLSWNIQMLPRGVKENGKAKRAKAIAERLKTKEYDVIVFQELFYHRSRKIITKALKKEYPFQTNVLNKKTFSLKTNGGVMLLSKHPIAAVHEIRYTNRTGPDRLSRKGALLAELNFKGRAVQVVGTHLQAFGAQEIMYGQYRQLFEELLRPNERPGIPQFICGDFNTIKVLPLLLPADLPKNYEQRLARYPVMLKTLQAEDGELSGQHQFTMDRPYNDLCKKRKEYRLLIDYFLVRSNQSPVVVHKRQVQIFKHAWHKEHKDLSDHYGLEAVVSGL